MKLTAYKTTLPQDLLIHFEPLELLAVVVKNCLPSYLWVMALVVT